MPPELAEALEVARRRHHAIAAGENDQYAALEGELAGLCAALSAAEASLTAADIPMLDELIALETQSRQVLETLMQETSQRMETLRASSRANGAYARSERFSVNGL